MCYNILMHYKSIFYGGFLPFFQGKSVEIDKNRLWILLILPKMAEIIYATLLSKFSGME